jgi:hypothetical protein
MREWPSPTPFGARDKGSATKARAGAGREPVGGLRLINEGLGWVDEGTPWNALQIPQWLRIAMFANTIAICTSLIVYIVVANTTIGDRATWVWNPVVSITMFIAATLLAARHLSWRRRRVTK